MPQLDSYQEERQQWKRLQDSVPAGVPGKWVEWISVKDQDGRRQSGVRYNRSLAHFTQDGKLTLCGREVNIETTLRYRKPVLCRVCQKKFNWLAQEAGE